MVGDKFEVRIGKSDVENVERRTSKMENKGLLSENKHLGTEGRERYLIVVRLTGWSDV